MSAHARRRWLRGSIAVAVALSTVLLVPAGASAQKPRGTGGDTERVGYRGFLLSKGRFIRFDARDPNVQVFPFGINDLGEVTGEYLRPDGESGLLRTRDGRVTSFDVPGAKGTEAFKINNRGEITVHYSLDTPFVNDSAHPRSAIVHRGRVTPIKVPGSTTTLVSGLNNKGHVVGSYSNADGVPRNFLWDRRKYTEIKTPGLPNPGVVDINDRGQIVGAYGTDPLAGSNFIWDKGRITTFDVPPGQPGAIVYDITNRGHIVGFRFLNNDLDNPITRGFLLTRGAKGPATNIHVPGATATGSTGINNNETITGAYFTSLPPTPNPPLGTP